MDLARRYTHAVCMLALVACATPHASSRTVATTRLTSAWKIEGPVRAMLVADDRVFVLNNAGDGDVALPYELGRRLQICTYQLVDGRGLGCTLSTSDLYGFDLRPLLVRGMIVGSVQNSDALVALDPRTAKVLWRSGIIGNTEASAWNGDTIFDAVMLDDHIDWETYHVEVVAISPAGTTLWRANPGPCKSVDDLVATAREVVLACEPAPDQPIEQIVFDAASGREIGRRRTTTHRDLRAFPGADGAIRYVGSQLELHALEVATGKLLWRWGLRDLPLNVREVAGRVVVQEGWRAVRAFVSGPRVVAPERAVIGGQIRQHCGVAAGARVHVGNVVVVVDAAGRFRADVEGRGAVAIWVEPDNPTSATTVPLDGTRSYELTIDLDRCDHD